MSISIVASLAAAPSPNSAVPPAEGADAHDAPASFAQLLSGRMNAKVDAEHAPKGTTARGAQTKTGARSSAQDEITDGKVDPEADLAADNNEAPIAGVQDDPAQVQSQAQSTTPEQTLAMVIASANAAGQMLAGGGIDPRAMAGGRAGTATTTSADTTDSALADGAGAARGITLEALAGQRALAGQGPAQPGAQDTGGRLLSGNDPAQSASNAAAALNGEASDGTPREFSLPSLEWKVPEVRGGDSTTGPQSPAVNAATNPASALAANAPASALGMQPGMQPDNQAMARLIGPQTALIEAPVGSREWAPALSGGVKLLVNNKSSVAEMQLTPADMGPIDIRIDFSQAAPVVAISVQNADTKNAMDAALPRLREMLADSGISLGGSGVEHRQENASRQASYGSDPWRSQGGERAESSVASPVTAVRTVRVALPGGVDTYA